MPQINRRLTVLENKINTDESSFPTVNVFYIDKDKMPVTVLTVQPNKPDKWLSYEAFERNRMEHLDVD